MAEQTTAPPHPVAGAAMSPEALARACADRMAAGDHAGRLLGIRIEAVSPGAATLSLEVVGEMVNGHGVCHGGLIFALADSAFAYACNSRNAKAVAQHCAVTFVNPARRADTLTAIAQERGVNGRSGIYDVTVRNQRGEVVAEFRGHSRTIPGAFFPEADTPP